MFRFSLSKATFLLLGLATFGCASTYKPIVTSSFAYADLHRASDSVMVSYARDIQRASENGWYHKKEVRYNMTAVAVKIENAHSVPIMIQKENFKIYKDGQEVRVISPGAYSANVRQRVGAHMWHALWGPWGISWSQSSDGTTDTDFYYIPAGLIVGIGNAVRADKANKANQTVVASQQIWGKVIAPHSTGYGLVLIPRTSIPVTFQYSDHGSTDVVNPVIVERDAALEQAHFNQEVVKGESNLYDFYVIMKDTKTKTVKTKIYTNSNPHYIIATDGARITPDQTESISRVDELGHQLLGIPHEKFWLFNVVSGRINTYYVLSEKNEKRFTHIQKDDGPILPFSPAMLKSMVDEDATVLDIINSRGNYLKAIKTYNKLYKN